MTIKVNISHSLRLLKSFAKIHRIDCERNAYSWVFMLFDKREHEKCKIVNSQKMELVNLFCEILHTGKNSDEAQKAQIEFVKKHSEYLDAYNLIYSVKRGLEYDSKASGISS